MSSQSGSLRQVALAAVVAAGLAATWCVLIAWVVGMAESTALRSGTYEQPIFRQDGEVVILRYPQGTRSNYQEIVDPSGQVSRATDARLLTPYYLYRPEHH